MVWFLFFTRSDVFCVIYYSTQTRNKIHVFVLYNKNSYGLLKDFGDMETKTVCWRDFILCVCPLIDHGQQPMKMHTEVTLLYIPRWSTPNHESLLYIKYVYQRITISNMYFYYIFLVFNMYILIFTCLTFKLWILHRDKYQRSFPKLQCRLLYADLDPICVLWLFP